MKLSSICSALPSNRLAMLRVTSRLYLCVHLTGTGMYVCCTQVRSCGMTGDAHHAVQPDPGGYGALTAMRSALALGGVAPEQVKYLNAHAASTPLGDALEQLAISKVGLLVLIPVQVLCSAKVLCDLAWRYAHESCRDSRIMYAWSLAHVLCWTFGLCRFRCIRAQS